MRKRFKIVFVIVTLLAIYQLAISAFATNNIRTILERHMLLLGDILLLLPLLAVPLGCRLFVRRPLAHIPWCPNGERICSEDSSILSSEGNTEITSLGAGQPRKPLKICSVQFGGAVRSTEHVAEPPIAGPVTCSTGNEQMGAVSHNSNTSSGNQQFAREILEEHELHAGRVYPVVEAGGQIKAVQVHEHVAQAMSNSRLVHSKPIAIRYKNGKSSFDPISHMKAHSEFSERMCDGEGSDSGISDDPLPLSTHLAGGVNAGEVSALQLHPTINKSIYPGRDQSFPAPNMSPLHCACTIDFWLLFGVFGAGSGCGLLLINNIGTSAISNSFHLQSLALCVIKKSKCPQ